LLARKTGDEAAAAYFASRFEATINAQQIAPGRQKPSLARKNAKKHHAVAAQQRPSRGLGYHLLLDAGRGAAGQRPAPAALHVEGRHAPTPCGAVERLALRGGRQQGAQPAKTVRCH